MEKDFNAAWPYVSLSAKTAETFTTAASEFANPGIPESLSNAWDQFQQEAFNNQYNPVAGESAKELKKPFMHWSLAGAIPDTHFADSGFATGPQMNNAHCFAEKGFKKQMPQQTVLFEACTINQPLNRSLREKCSTGSYYFLK